MESGRAWSELCAVELRVSAAIVEAPETVESVEAALAEKYGGFRPRRSAMPERSRVHYGGGSAIIALTPVAAPLSWDNAQIALAPSAS